MARKKSRLPKWLRDRYRLAVLEALRPFFGVTYRRRRGNCPQWLLTTFDIATPEARPDFATVARLLDNLPDGAAIIECGVARGASLMGIMHRLYRRRVPRATVYGLDSFQGLPDPAPQDAQLDGTFHPLAVRGTFSGTLRQLVAWRLRTMHWPYQTRLVPGFFEATLPTLDARRFDFIHLDCDLYDSYQVCLRELYPRLLPGGVMVFDEYEEPWARYPGSKRAIDEFLADKPEKPECFSDLPKPRWFIRKR